jgi:hypothetical protein
MKTFRRSLEEVMELVMQNQNRLPTETLGERRKNLAKSADVLSKFFRRWAVIFPNHPTGGEALAYYLEALSDLTADQIEAGCAEAIKTAEQFPKPGHIRAVVPAVQHIFLGVPQLTYPAVSPEEREEALEYSEALRTTLVKSPRIGPVATKDKPKVAVPPSRFTIEEQKEILRKKGHL